MGFSRIAAVSPPTGAGVYGPVQPFSLRGDFEGMMFDGFLRYKGGCYVTQVTPQEDRVQVSYTADGVPGAASFDAVFLGAGCVNTTAIVDRSLGQPGTRDYSIRAPRGVIHAFLRFPWKNSAASQFRHRHGLPEIFLEVHSRLTNDTWSHTQLTRINEQIVEAICSRLPRFLHPFVRLFRHIVYFALSNQTSADREAAVLRSSLDADGADSMRQTVSITEHPLGRYPELVRAVRHAVAKHWRMLRMVPVPFGEQLADFFRGNRLGGWHFGGSLPMRERPTRPEECWPTGEIAGLANAYVLDSSAFPSVPASTVALLTAAHGHRVARSWRSRHVSGAR